MPRLEARAAAAAVVVEEVVVEVGLERARGRRRRWGWPRRWRRGGNSMVRETYCVCESPWWRRGNVC